ncbi:MAG: tRNA (adenine-N1)-methyltransferase, partial [Candidatus Omnitrophica bacterium]|nr:tRNA (adenine-N1)-methyltransferase [Candidatus Omnitrophota bacterium]
ESTGNLIQEGSALLLWFEDESTYLVTVQKEKKFGIHCGRPIDLGALIGKQYGSWFETSSNIRALLLEPTIEDFVMKAKRESGIIYPKDAAILMMKCGIRSGSRVIEVGVGSGSLTTALAAQVAPNGMIYSYDVREDFLKLAEGNLKKASVLDFVKLTKREGHEPFHETDVDALILDVPEPWHEIENIKASLKSGGRIASLNPTYNQIEQMSGALQKGGFIMIEAQEILVRGILARPGKTRPEQRMVSHTEFLLFAVKPGDVISV